MLVLEETGRPDAESENVAKVEFVTLIGSTDRLSCAEVVLLEAEGEVLIMVVETDSFAETWFPAVETVALTRTLAAVEVDADSEPANTLPIPALARTDCATVEASAASMSPPAFARADNGLVLV